jgi:hypothetical protein
MHMSEIPSSSKTRSRVLIAGGVFLILLSTLLVFPSAARTDMQHIQAGDMIFIYEQNLDITGLRTGIAPITSLRKYRDDNPASGLLREVPVPDETSFSPTPEIFGGQYGIYYAFNQADGAMNSVFLSVPSVSVDAVLASPNHIYSLSGLTIPEGTSIAFKISSGDVGSSYHAGALYPATVDVVLTTPGGGELTSIQGMDFSGLNVSSAAFYTDDPGRPGAISLDGFEPGPYSVQAKWRDPASFDHQAPDSNIYSFTVGKETAFQTTPTPVATMVTTLSTTLTQTTPVPRTTPATAPLPPASPSAPPVTSPGSTTPAGIPQQSPTPAPIGAWLAVLSPALALLLLRERARR